VNDAGDVLSSVVAPTRGSTEWCQTTASAALVWSGHDGSRRSWTGDVMARIIGPAGNGFVVGAARPDCARSATGPHGGAGPYLITASGSTVAIRWPAGEDGVRAREICGADPRDERCVFSADDQTGRLRTTRGLPPAGKIYLGRQADVLMATSPQRHDLWWSLDEGASWQVHQLGIPSLRGVSPLVNDRVIALVDGTTVDYTTDRGRTWTARALPRAFDSVAITDSGILVGVVAPAVRNQWAAYRVVVSTDATWSDLREMPARATLGPLWAEVHGDAVYVHNRPDRWWVSTDAGAHWRVVEPLPVS
jgi:hypothetical protein